MRISIDLSLRYTTIQAIKKKHYLKKNMPQNVSGELFQTCLDFLILLSHCIAYKHTRIDACVYVRCITVWIIWNSSYLLGADMQLLSSISPIFNYGMCMLPATHLSTLIYVYVCIYIYTHTHLVRLIKSNIKKNETTKDTKHRKNEKTKK